MEQKSDIHIPNIEKIDLALSKIRNLPSLPNIIHEVDNIIHDPASSAAHLSKVISKDQGLSAKILTVANSPLYGFPRRVSTIDFAIVILGFNHIRNIVIAFSILESCSGFCSAKFDQTKYVLHSIMTATVARKLAVDLGYPNSGESFTAGLLHDLGLSLVCRYFSKEFRKIIEIVESGEAKYMEAENQILGFDHRGLGFRLLEKWNLPQSLSQAVLFHHNPSEAQDKSNLAAIVHLADYLTNHFDLGGFIWDAEPDLDEGIIKILRLGNKEYLDKFIDSYELLLKNQLQLITL